MSGSILDYFRIVIELYKLRKYAKKESQARHALSINFGNDDEYRSAVLGVQVMTKHQYYAAKNIKLICMDNAYNFEKISEWK